MLQFKNTTPFQGKIWLLPDPEGIDSIYTVVKATFVLGVKPVLAEKQAPVNLQDEYHGEPGQSSLKAASDLGLIKPASDVMLLGTAFASKGQKTTQMEVSLTVGPVVKKVLVFGDRAWQSGLVGSRPSAPTPFATMPLIWERAFGGNDRTEGDKPEVTAEARNPVGAGFRHAKGLKKLDGLKLPNLEDPKQPIAGWKDRSTPVCFAPICAHWEPRRAYVGTYDDAWKKRAPYVPKDFNARFFQLAPPDLQVPGYLKGGEPVEILGATPNGSLRFQLPEARIQVTYRLDNQDHVGAANLDTVLIEPDQSRLVLVWRSVFACDKRALRVREVEAALAPGRREK